MKIQILGTGCAKCRMLADNAREAADDMGVDYEIEKVTDLNDIMKFGVMVTPAIAIDGAVKMTGKVLSVDAIKEMLAG